MSMVYVPDILVFKILNAEYDKQEFIKEAIEELLNRRSKDMLK